MVNWFWQRRKGVAPPRIRPRAAVSGAATKVDLAELTPTPIAFLGRAAYVQLMIFENLGRAITAAPSTAAKSVLSEASASSLTKFQSLTAEIERNGDSVSAAMDPYASEIDQFERTTRGADWFEAVTTSYLTAGFLDDFFVQLSRGLPEASSERVETALADHSGEEKIAALLLSFVESNPRLGARLALWGRRLVGDTMLIARSALALSNNPDSDEARIEPVFTELIAAHTRRMDALGLTA